MIIFLYGPDSYRRRKKLNEVVGEYQRKHSNLTLEYFDLEMDDEFNRLQEFALSRSLFKDVKMAVIGGIFEIEFKKEVKQFLKSQLKTDDLTLVISSDQKPVEDSKFLTEKPVLSQEFENLSGERLKFFIRKEAQSRNIDLTPQAVNFLAENFKENTWGLITELEKISSVGKKSLDTAELQKFGDFYESPNIFDFIGLFLRGNFNRKTALRNLELLFLSHEEPAKIFNILASMSRSPELINRLADYDVAIKSGKLGYEEILLDLALG